MDPSKSDEARAQEVYEREQAEAYALLDEIDPDWDDLVEWICLILTLYNPVSAAWNGNSDEYSPEAVDIAVELHECETAYEVQELVHAVFVHWFSVSDEQFDEYEGIARDLWTYLTVLA